MPLKVNPQDLISQIREGQNPQQLMINILEQNMKETPMGENLLRLAREGRTADIETIARNMFQEKGLDFDKEFMAFRKNLGL